MNKSLSYAELSLELQVVWTFWLGSNISGIISLHFVQPSYELERPAFEDLLYFGAELIFVAANFLQQYPWC